MKILVIKLCMVLFCFPLVTVAQEQLKLTENQLKNLGIETIMPVAVTSVRSRLYPGKVVIPNDQIRILSPMFSGLVKVLYVAEGDEIKVGQKLAEISSSAFLEQRQNYIEARSRYKIAQRNHRRNEELLKEGIISEKSFLAGQSLFNEAAAALSRAKQSLTFSGLNDQQFSELEHTQTMKKSMTVTAPFDGVILKQIANTGEHVDEDVALYHIGQLDPLWLEIHVPLSVRETIEIGNVISLKNYNIKSEIITIGSMIHEDDQGIIVRGQLRNPETVLIPGQMISASLEQKISGAAYYRIPNGSLIRDDTQATIFVKNNSGFISRPARIVADEGQTIIIESNLLSSDQVAFKGIIVLKGMLEGLGSEE